MTNTQALSLKLFYFFISWCFYEVKSLLQSFLAKQKYGFGIKFSILS